MMSFQKAAKAGLYGLESDVKIRWGVAAQHLVLSLVVSTDFSLIFFVGKCFHLLLIEYNVEI